MKYLKIQNNGVLDIRLVALMGGTTKTGDKFKIGQFGTGLKYTLAYLFRQNIDFKIISGLTKVDINTERETIGETEFEIICIDGHRTSITTSMGMQWSAWMILRELWCNALDEGGELKEIVHDPEFTGEEGKTTFYIQINQEIQTVLDEWKSYFIHHKEPMWENDEYAIYENTDGGKLKLYKQGVLIYQNPDTESLFLYDIKGADINELREFRGSVNYEVFSALRKPNQDTISYFLQHVKEEHYEGSQLDYDWFTSFASVWRDAIGENRIAGIGSSTYYDERGVNVDFSNVIQLPKKVYKALIKSFEGIGALVMVDPDTEFFEVNNSPLKDRITEAVEVLSGCGYNISEQAKFRYGIFNNHNRKSSAIKKSKSILISDVCLKITMEELCAILIRHNEFISNNYDETKSEFGFHFINLYTRQLLAKNEIEI